MEKFFATSFMAVSVAIAPTVASASTGSLPVNIGKGEMIFEVFATGVSKLKPSKISGFCMLSSGGDSQKSAKQALDIELSKIKSLGTDKIFFDTSAEPALTETMGESAAAAAAATAAAVVDAAADAVREDNAAAAAVDPDNAKKIADKIFQYDQKIVFGGVDGASYLSAIKMIENTDCNVDYNSKRTPKIEIADMAAARSIAFQAGLSDAKMQAQKYSQTLGMQVGAIIKISMVNDIKSFLGDEMSSNILNDIKRDVMGKRKRDADDLDTVEVVESMTVEFVLKPK
jgi:hypothetical protein